MQTFATTQRSLDRPAAPRVAASGLLGNPPLHARNAGKASAADATAGFAHDFSRIPTIATMGLGDDSRKHVVAHAYPFSASVRLIGPAWQNDASSVSERKPTNRSAPSTMATAVPTGSHHRPLEGETVRYPDGELAEIALPQQRDTIAGTLGYVGSITRQNPPPDAGDFGTTRPYFTMTDRAATQAQDVFTVTGKVNAKVTFQVGSGGRANIASATDPAITQTNYPKVVSDLTPAAAAGSSLMKNQPPRTAFWAEDLTIRHERFHAAEDVSFGQSGTAAAQTWLHTQTARSYDEIGALFAPALQKVVAHVDAAMAPPGREERAYADGAADYRARAQAIKSKGDATGYVPAPPTPPQTVSPRPAPTVPTPAPQTPGK